MASMCINISAQEPDEFFLPVPEEYMVTDITIEEISVEKQISEELSPDFIILPPMILYQYEHSIDDLGEMYFPNLPFDTLHNATDHVMEVSDTWSTTASVKIVGSISANMEDYFSANYGFDFSYENTFSRNITTELDPGESLYLYVSYATYKITEIKMPIATITDPSTFTTSIQYVHKPVGLIYTN